MIIAVDGPAASGKGTLARRLAARYNLAYLDTGLLYRAAALLALRRGGDARHAADALAAAGGIPAALLEEPEIRSDRVAQAASVAAAEPSVRAALLGHQRDFARNPPDGKAGAVLDGRDIGTVVCPDAAVKIFVVASLETRARRRHKELRERGQDSIYARVLQEMKERDARDSGRDLAPLVAAPDALRLDTTSLGEDAAFEAAVSFIESWRESRASHGAASQNRGATERGE